METMLIYPVGSSPACGHAATILESLGISCIDHPSPEVTHLLLDVPSFRPDGTLRGGGRLDEVLSMLPPEVTVIGGNLQHPALGKYQVIDLLQDPSYVAENAAITAHCTLELALPMLPVTLVKCPVLVIGWGRIGKCLGKLLTALTTDVTIAARQEADRAMIRALGYKAVDTAELQESLGSFRLIFNTAPELLIDEALLPFCRSAVKIDLASQQGIAGEDVLWARGLPGKRKPESSGRLIAETILRLFTEELL